MFWHRPEGSGTKCQFLGWSGPTLAIIQRHPLLIQRAGRVLLRRCFRIVDADPLRLRVGRWQSNEMAVKKKKAMESNKNGKMATGKSPKGKLPPNLQRWNVPPVCQRHSSSSSYSSSFPFNFTCFFFPFLVDQPEGNLGQPMESCWIELDSSKLSAEYPSKTSSRFDRC